MKNITFILSLCMALTVNTIHSMKRTTDDSLESACTKKICVYTHMHLPQEHHETLEIHPLYTMQTEAGFWNFSHQTNYNPWYMPSNLITQTEMEQEDSGMQIDYGTYYIPPITQSTTRENIVELEKIDDKPTYQPSPPSVSKKSGTLSSSKKAPNKFSCTFAGCEKSFPYKCNLTSHMRKHTGEKPYICTFEGCDKSFTIKDNLKTHTRTHTGEKPHTCTFEGCNKSFADRSYLNKHMRIHTGKKPYTCTIKGCDKSFINNTHLTSHMRKHTREKPYTCNICERAFSQSNNLTTHMRTHSDEKSYAYTFCTFEGCDKSFADKSNLKRHMKIHTGEKPCACTFEGCDKSFITKEKLDRHLRAHTGEKPYICTFEDCDKSYADKVNLDKHRETHYGSFNLSLMEMGEGYHECAHCCKSFTDESQLEQHMQIHTIKNTHNDLCKDMFNQLDL